MTREIGREADQVECESRQQRADAERAFADEDQAGEIQALATHAKAQVVLIGRVGRHRPERNEQHRDQPAVHEARRVECGVEHGSPFR